MVNSHFQDAIGEPRSTWLSVPMILFAGVVLFIAWAAWFEIDQSVRASGQIIPTARTQTVQVVDGGVLARVLVSEGQSVVAGQLVAQLGSTRTKANHQQIVARHKALYMALIRAQAESRQQTPDFGDQTGFTELLVAQQQLYWQQRRNLDAQLATLEQALQLAHTQWQLNVDLYETGDVSRVAVLQAKGKVEQLQGEIIAATNQYLLRAHEEVSQLKAELDVVRHQLKESADLMQHTEIRSPATGVVKHLAIHTLGAVLVAGEELMQISPTDGELLVEVKINPMDIGQLALGMPTVIKLDAFDYSIFGSLQGELSYISSDTLEEQNVGQQQSFYLARISIDQDAKSAHPTLAAITLKPGMTISVDIQTSQRSVLYYLAKPLTRAFAGALTER